MTITAKMPDSAGEQQLTAHVRLARELAGADVAVLLLSEPGSGDLVPRARVGDVYAIRAIPASAPVAGRLAAGAGPLCSGADGSDWAYET